ncbi:PTS system mannose/fructose/sorbose family transporter subunit IID [Lederbergia citri]|uniref:PTS system mannose/fructose/sorbose family transporter subunit IID n=1 Tax=Lederbergia citri TaxID=2833580 RepID=A0A942TGN9_9BACI|nr:PTS system mannose/fructose/sorbose family transporter subunit IID [Lederbergia citri]MBS4195779.1 PTS system mannose/fructose/sorbose family transporter subunit IID [Lederbergia citri]
MLGEEKVLDYVENFDNSEKQEMKVSKKVLNAVARRVLLFENSVNFERMQSLAFTYTMIPVLKVLYKDKQELSKALQRHLQFFNSNVATASLITGVTVAMEEQKASGKDISDDTINGMKTGLMGPAAGIGDALFWGTFVPIVGGITASMAMSGNGFAPILHQIIRIIVYVAFTFLFVKFGYRQGINLFQMVGQDTVKKITQGSTILAATVIGGLVASLVHAQTGLAMKSGDMSIKIQEIADQMLPNLVPISIFFLVFYLLNKRKWSPLLVIGFVFLLGIVASYFKILIVQN